MLHLALFICTKIAYLFKIEPNVEVVLESQLWHCVLLQRYGHSKELCIDSFFSEFVQRADRRA